ncbi:hypothetical protein [Vreelandella sp. EE7]
MITNQVAVVSENIQYSLALFILLGTGKKQRHAQADFKQHAVIGFDG